MTVFSVDSATGDTVVSGDTIISGDLTVNGITTTINTTNLSVEDTIIELNRNGSLGVDMGFLFTKSSDPKPVFYWNSLYNNRFDLATVTGATATSTNLWSLTQTPTGLNMGALTATTGSFSSTLGVTGVTTLGNNVQINWASGTTRTFQIQQTGLAYPYFWVNNSGNVQIGGVGATAQFLAKIDANTVTSNLGTTNISGPLTIDTDQQLNFKKPTSPSTSAIILNSDRTSSGQEAVAKFVEVKRGALTSSSITWNESYSPPRWEIEPSIKVGTNPLTDFAEFFATSIFYNDVTIGSSTTDTATIASSSLFYGSSTYEDDARIKFNMFSTSDIPAILLNADETGTPTSDVIAIEVERGTETNANIKWDEVTNNWDINTNLYSQKIKIRTDETSGSSSRVYIYFYHGLGMLNEEVYFYIYKTTDSGVTREVIPITIVTSSRIEAYTSNGYNAIKFNSNTPYSSHANADAFIDMEDGASYYINVYSPNSSGLSPNVHFSFRSTSNVGLSADYTTDEDLDNADFIAIGGYNGLIQVNNATPLVAPVQAFSAATTISDNVDNQPALSLEYSKGISSIVLNAGVIDTPADASILVDRGLESPAKLLWDESANSWIINQNVRLNDSTNTPNLYLGHSSSIYLDEGSVWIKEGILALESRSSNTIRIYLNSELGIGDTPNTDAKITVNRGKETNAEIKWDETNDRWDFNSPIYFQSNVTLGSSNFDNVTINSNTIINSKFILSRSELLLSDVSNGAITVTKGYHTLLPPDGFPSIHLSSDLTTINGGVGGMIVVLQAGSDLNTIVVRNGGNIFVSGGSFSLDSIHDTITLIYNDITNKWCEICHSGNG